MDFDLEACFQTTVFGMILSLVGGCGSGGTGSTQGRRGGEDARAEVVATPVVSQETSATKEDPNRPRAPDGKLKSGSEGEAVIADQPTAITGAFLTASCLELPKDISDPANEKLRFGCAVFEKDTGKKVDTGSSLADWSVRSGDQVDSPFFVALPESRLSTAPQFWDVEFRMSLAQAKGARIRVQVKNYRDPKDATLETVLNPGANDAGGGLKVRGISSANLVNLGDGVAPQGCDPARVSRTAGGNRISLPLIVTSDEAKIQLVLGEVCGGITMAPSDLVLRITREGDRASLFDTVMQKGVPSMVTNEVTLRPGVYRAVFSVEVGVPRVAPFASEQRLAFGSFLVLTRTGTVAVGDPQYVR